MERRGFLASLVALLAPIEKFRPSPAWTPPEPLRIVIDCSKPYVPPLPVFWIVKNTAGQVVGIEGRSYASPDPSNVSIGSVEDVT